MHDDDKHTQHLESFQRGHTQYEIFLRRVEDLDVLCYVSDNSLRLRSLLPDTRHLTQQTLKVRVSA